MSLSYQPTAWGVMSLFRFREQANGLDAFPGLLPNPSVAFSVRFPTGTPRRIVVGGEGGIVQTTDEGSSWKVVLSDQDRFYFDVLQDPLRPSRLVTASWLKNFDTPQHLVTQVSEDGGASCVSHRHPDPNLFGGAWSMFVAIEGGRTMYYVGLYRDGVMRVEIP